MFIFLLTEIKWESFPRGDCVCVCVWIFDIKRLSSGLGHVLWNGLGAAAGRREYQKAVGERCCSTFIIAQFAEGVSQSAISAGE